MDLGCYANVSVMFISRPVKSVPNCLLIHWAESWSVPFTSEPPGPMAVPGSVAAQKNNCKSHQTPLDTGTPGTLVTFLQQRESQASDSQPGPALHPS